MSSPFESFGPCQTSSTTWTTSCPLTRAATKTARAISTALGNAGDIIPKKRGAISVLCHWAESKAKCERHNQRSRPTVPSLFALVSICLQCSTEITLWTTCGVVWRANSFVMINLQLPRTDNDTRQNVLDLLGQKSGGSVYIFLFINLQCVRMYLCRIMPYEFICIVSLLLCIDCAYIHFQQQSRKEFNFCCLLINYWCCCHHNPSI